MRRISEPIDKEAQVGERRRDEGHFFQSYGLSEAKQDGCCEGEAIDLRETRDLKPACWLWYI